MPGVTRRTIERSVNHCENGKEKEIRNKLAKTEDSLTALSDSVTPLQVLCDTKNITSIN